MAEAKDKKKPAAAPSPFGKNHLNETMIMVAILLLLSLAVNRVMVYISNFDSLHINSFLDQVVRWFLNGWHIWKGVAVVLIVVCLAWALYSKLRLREIEKVEAKLFGAEPEDAFLEASDLVEKKNEKWLHVLALLNSDSANDWRLAIIEADVILDETLKIAGYHGDSIGDKLKSVDPSDLLTLDAAWEAHKVRNRIAHSGADFELTNREVKRVVSLFESVFKELQVI